MTQQLISLNPKPAPALDEIALLRANIHYTLESLAGDPPRLTDSLHFDVTRWPSGGGFRVVHGDTLWIVLDGGYIIEGSYDRSSPDPKVDLALLLQRASCSPFEEHGDCPEDLSTTSLFLSDKYEYRPSPGTLGFVFADAVATLQKEQHVFQLALQALRHDLVRSKEVRQEIAALENHLYILSRAQEGLVLEQNISAPMADRLKQNLLDWRGESANEMTKRVRKAIESPPA